MFLQILLAHTFIFQTPSTTELLQHIHRLRHKIIHSDTKVTPTFNINTIHSSLDFNTVTSRTTSKPTMPTFPTNPLQQSQTSTNVHITQNSVNSIVHSNQTTTRATTIRNDNVSVPQGSSITVHQISPV